VRLWKSREKVEKLVLQHLGQVREAIDAFEQATRAGLSEGDWNRAKHFALLTHTAEGKADDTRREVEESLIRGALLAPSRRRILELIDLVDSLANAAESSLDVLLVQRVEVPEENVGDILQILDATLELFDNVEGAIRKLFSGPREDALRCTARIDELEGKIDHIERDITRRIFRSDRNLASKLHIRDYVEELVKLSDRAEDLADRIALILAEQAA